METNIGSTDRAVRLVVGTVLAVSGVAVLAGVSSLGPVVGGVALLLGAILVGTALANVCLLYELVGVDTT
jgi:hypothetical protein